MAVVFCGPLRNSPWRRRRDSNPRYGYPYDALAKRWFQPLTHVSLAAMRGAIATVSGSINRTFAFRLTVISIQFGSIFIAATACCAITVAGHSRGMQR